MRKVFQEIVCHKIHKVVRIQKEDTNENDLERNLNRLIYLRY
jgi:hypothetical protein